MKKDSVRDNKINVYWFIFNYFDVFWYLWSWLIEFILVCEFCFLKVKFSDYFYIIGFIYLLVCDNILWYVILEKVNLNLKCKVLVVNDNLWFFIFSYF